MSFWDIFKGNEKNNGSYQSGLHEKITKLLPSSTEKELILITCVAGLMSRVAYVDFKLHESELSLIEESLKTWTKLEHEDIVAVRKIAMEEIKELAGLENHKYCHPLNDIMDNDEKSELLEALFALAAADGDVEQKESEEIRIICKGLNLDPRHYLSARAKVAAYLKTFKV